MRVFALLLLVACATVPTSHVTISDAERLNDQCIASGNCVAASELDMQKVVNESIPVETWNASREGHWNYTSGTIRGNVAKTLLGSGAINDVQPASILTSPLTAPGGTFNGTVTVNGDVNVGTGVTISNGGGDLVLHLNEFIYWDASNQAGAGNITSNMSAATSGATPATSMFKFYPQNALDATDWVFDVANAANATSLFNVAYNGNVTALGTITGGFGNLSSANGLTLTGGGVAQTTASNTEFQLYGNASDSSSNSAVASRSNVTLTAGSDRYIHRFCRDSSCTNVMARVNTQGDYTEVMGTGTGFASGVGTANTTVVPVASNGNASTLMSYTLPANSLVQAGRCLKVHTWGHTTNSANAKTVSLAFGGQTIMSKALAISLANGLWRINALICRTGTSTQQVFAEGWNDDATTVSGTDGATVLYAATQTNGTQTETATIIIKGVATTATTTEITQDGMIVEYQ